LEFPTTKYLSMYQSFYTRLFALAVAVLSMPMLASAQDCEAGILITTDTATLTCNGSGGETFDLEATGVMIPTGGSFGWVFTPGETGSGSLGGEFILTGAPNPATYDNDLNGLLSANNLPPFAGQWTVKGAVYTNPNDAFNTICDFTEDSLIVSFTPYIESLVDNGDNSATVTVAGGTPPYSYVWSDGQATATATNLAPDIYSVTVTDANGCSISGELGVGGAVTCQAGVINSALDQTVCPGDSVFLSTDASAVVPTNGGRAWLFSNSQGGTGGTGGNLTLFGVGQSGAYTAGLNGILAANNLPPLAGVWVIRSGIYTDETNPTGTICSTSTDSVVVNFLTTDDVVSVDGVTDNEDGTATVNASGGMMPYTYLWSDGQTTATASGLMEGSYTVTVTDANGCTDEGSVNIGDVAADPCLDWVAPEPGEGFVDFNTAFGGAPCDDGSGCPFNEIDAFEVFASEAYAVDNFQEGGTYTFSICNGPGAGTWVPEFTIIAPSGAVDAFGPGDGDGCSITWTASESGTYLIVINEAGECGGGPNTGTGNGFPALTCEDGTTSCEVEECVVGEMQTTGEISVCGEGATFELEVDSMNMDIPSAGGFGWVFTNDQGGTGALGGNFIFTGVEFADTYDADLNGVLSANNFPEFEGTWVIYAAVTADLNAPFDAICATSTDSLVVNFFAEGPSIDEITAGDGTATVTVSGGAAPYTYEWSDGQTTETATDLVPGEYTVTVTDANGCTVTGTVDVMVSTQAIEGLNSFYMGPNPTTGTVDLSLRMDSPLALQIELQDITGRTLFRLEEDKTTDFKRTIDLSSYSDGVYLIRIITENGQLTKRLVVSK
jgi:hypothetical protein